MPEDPQSTSVAGLSRQEVLALPVVVDVTTAARALGVSRSTGYELARRGEFPSRVIRVGSSYRVPTADLLRVLGVEPDVSPSHSAVCAENSARCPREKLGHRSMQSIVKSDIEDLID